MFLSALLCQTDCSEWSVSPLLGLLEQAHESDEDQACGCELPMGEGRELPHVPEAAASIPYAPVWLPVPILLFVTAAVPSEPDRDRGQSLTDPGAGHGARSLPKATLCRRSRLGNDSSRVGLWSTTYKEDYARTR